MKTPLVKKPKVVFNQETFKAVIQKASRDENFRKQLDAQPVAALQTVGILLPDKVAKNLIDRRLSEIIQFGDFGPGSRANVAVDVAISVAVDVVVEVAVKTKAKWELEPIDELSYANVAKVLNTRINAINKSKVNHF